MPADILPAAKLLDFQFRAFHQGIDDLTLDCGAIDKGASDDAGTAGVGDQDMIECDGLTRLSVSHKVDLQNVSRSDFVLTVSVFDDGKHDSLASRNAVNNCGYSGCSVIACRKYRKPRRIVDYGREYEPPAEARDEVLRLVISAPISLKQRTSRCSGPTFEPPRTLIDTS